MLTTTIVKTGFGYELDEFNIHREGSFWVLQDGTERVGSEKRLDLARTRMLKERLAKRLRSLGGKPGGHGPAVYSIHLCDPVTGAVVTKSNTLRVCRRAVDDKLAVELHIFNAVSAGVHLIRLTSQQATVIGALIADAAAIDPEADEREGFHD